MSDTGGTVVSMAVVKAALAEIKEARDAYRAEKRRLRALGYSKRSVGAVATAERQRHQRAWFWIEELATYQIDTTHSGRAQGGDNV